MKKLFLAFAIIALVAFVAVCLADDAKKGIGLFTSGTQYRAWTRGEE